MDRCRGKIIKMWWIIRPPPPSLHRLHCTVVKYATWPNIFLSLFLGPKCRKNLGFKTKHFVRNSVTFNLRSFNINANLLVSFNRFKLIAFSLIFRQWFYKAFIDNISLLDICVLFEALIYSDKLCSSEQYVSPCKTFFCVTFSYSALLEIRSLCVSCFFQKVFFWNRN